MVFNIGSQSGGVVNNVAGDQHVSGTQTGVSISVTDARAAAEALRQALDRMDLSALPGQHRGEIVAEADRLAVELDAEDPPKVSVADRLTRLTSLLRDAGAFAGAAASLVGPLTTIAAWLGPLGASALSMLAL